MYNLTLYIENRNPTQFKHTHSNRCKCSLRGKCKCTRAPVLYYQNIISATNIYIYIYIYSHREALPRFIVRSYLRVSATVVDL